MSGKRLELTAIVHTFNEEKNIAACLDTLRWVDELIVVDMYSTDRTVEIARHYTDKVLFFENAGYVEPARNFALSQAQKDWILVVDADERVTERLKQEIIEKVLTGVTPITIVAANDNPRLLTPAPAGIEFSAYYIPVVDYRFGRWAKYGPGSSELQRQYRLLKRGKCEWPPEVHGYPRVDGPMSLMNGPLLHLSHLEISNFLNKLNKYTTFEAQQRFEKGIRYSWFNTLGAGLYQIYNILIKQKTYKEGAAAFVETILLTMYTLIYRAKLWELHYKAAHPDAINQHEPLAKPEKLEAPLSQTE